MTSIQITQSPIVVGVRERLPRLVRYGAVSIVSTAFSLAILTTLVATGTASPGWANVIATLAGAVPSFELNRHWVWKHTDDGRVRMSQAAPFVALSLAGLALSTLTVTLTGSWAQSSGMSSGSQAIIAALANMVAFGSLWLVQFGICDRHLFRDRTAPVTGAGAAGSAIAVDAPIAIADEPRRSFGERARSMVRSKPDDPRWYRPAFVALLVATAVAWTWGLSASGWANGFYSAAAQAASKSWKAFFFGSFDSSNAITVDKPPAAMWVMGLSARIFGVSSWSILVPEALMGVGTVALLVATIKRWFSPGAALVAGVVAATTPVAALMFRFNNPDALLVLLLTAAAYAVTRAIERGQTKWLVAAGTFIGFGFLTKMMQAFVVVPALAFAYLVAAPTGWWRKIRQTFVFGLTSLAAASWWVAIVELWPTSSRPYIGGSQTNSVLELIFGYNGLGRLTGNETGSVGGGTATAGTTGQWGATGIWRMFNSEFGGQISWLLPAALMILLGGLVWTIRRPLLDRTRAALLLWGGWLGITGLLFSLSKGIIHPYYAVALMPAIAALVGIGAWAVWTHRDRWIARIAGASTVLVSGVWSWTLLGRSADFQSWLRPTVIVVAALSSWLILMGLHVRRIAALAVIGAGGAMLAGPFAYSVQTVATPHTGSLPTAGPSTGSTMGGFGGGRPGGFGGGHGGPPAGGLLSTATASTELVTALQKDASDYDWVAATVGSNNAAGYQLGSGEPVMSVGGFNGSDPAPTLAQFMEYVAAGRIHFFVGGNSVAGGGFGGGPGMTSSSGSSASSDITSWVTSNYTATTVGGATVYDLTEPAATN